MRTYIMGISFPSSLRTTSNQTASRESCGPRPKSAGTADARGSRGSSTPSRRHWTSSNDGNPQGPSVFLGGLGFRV